MRARVNSDRNAVRHVKTMIGHSNIYRDFLCLIILAFIIIIIIQITIKDLMACQSKCALFGNKSCSAYEHALNHNDSRKRLKCDCPFAMDFTNA